MNSKTEGVLYIRSANNSRSSIDLQRLKGEEYAKQNSMSLSIIEDAHSSGISQSNERAGLQWLVHLIEVGLIKLLSLNLLLE